VSTVWDAMGPLYAKLGLTAAELIAARKKAADAGYRAFKRPHLAGAIRGALGLPVSSDVVPVFDAMREADPTLDLEPSDKEAQILLGSILRAELNSSSELGLHVALGLVTAGFGGTRRSEFYPNLPAEADRRLASRQLAAASVARPSPAPEMPEEVTQALNALTATQTQTGYGVMQVLAPAPAMAAIKKIADYAHAAHVAAANQSAPVMGQVRRLEEELRTYWWVVGAWSDGRQLPFGKLPQGEAALRAGAELAAKTTLPAGLFAAPALLDKVLKSDRAAKLSKMALSAAVAVPDAVWRGETAKSVGPNSDLLPVLLALSASGESGEGEDWRPRFKRLTGLSADVSLSMLDLALQLYREVLFARVLPAAK
jgi:hypothetical protein